jgi:hypothetical protein
MFNSSEELLHETIETMHPMDNGAFISRYITCAEYQLFLDDMLEVKQLDWKPYHWTTGRFAPGNALAPLAGLDGWQADAFCNWLSERREQTFRLPTPTEIAHYAIEPDNLGVWCAIDVREYSFEGLSESSEQAIMSRLRNLAGKPSGFSQPSNLALYLAGNFVGLRNRELARALDLNDDFVLALIRYRHVGLDLAFISPSKATSRR